MKKKLPRIVLFSLVGCGVILFGFILSQLVKGNEIALLDPKGWVANEQHWLLITSTLIMLSFGVPVIATVYFFIWKYRDDNQTAHYAPEEAVGRGFLAFAWGGPLVVVLILASLMLPATQQLEPQKPIDANKDQLTVQVVALNWKWLFIYPEQNIATVNFVQIPVDTPVRFELTADEAPMNSFWIPHLGGMLYAMTGHVNPLHLIGDTVGDYSGGAAEINGRGLAGMRFTTRVSSQEDFEVWVDETKQNSLILDDYTYNKLLAPSENNAPAFYINQDPYLYDKIVSKYDSSHRHGAENQEDGSQ